MKQILFRLLDALGINALFRRANRGRIKVLLYHNITPGRRGFENAITPEEFEAQLRYLKSRYNPVRLDQSGRWHDYRPDKVNLLITFDDGFLNNLDVAAPILARHGLSAVFFLIADCLPAGAPPPFAGKYGNDDPDGYRTIDEDGAKKLLELGMTVGSHSLAHRDFSKLDDAEAMNDAFAAKAQLEAALGIEVALFAFPWGLHRPGQDEQLAKIYKRVFLTEHGFAGPGDRIFPRNEVAGGLHLRAAASGALDFTKRLLP